MGGILFYDLISFSTCNIILFSYPPLQPARTGKKIKIFTSPPDKLDELSDSSKEEKVLDQPLSSFSKTQSVVPPEGTPV